MLTTTLTKNSNIAVVITAAGSSTRMGGGIKKEYLPLKNGTVLSNCAINFLNAIQKPFNLLNLIITHPKNGQEAAYNALFSDSDFCEIIKKNKNITIEFVQGGETRQASVLCAVRRIAGFKNKPDFVLVHDGARPFVTSQIIQDVINATKEFGAAVPGIVPTDTQKEIDDSGMIIRHLRRDKLVAVQTPQGFEFEPFYKAHEQAQKDNISYTDDTEIWGNYVGPVKVVKGDVINKKITYAGDI